MSYQNSTSAEAFGPIFALVAGVIISTKIELSFLGNQ
jgi:hypothetical protein